MAVQKKVAELIAERQIDLGLTNQQVANGIGYANPNVISMIKKGNTKLPLDKVTKAATTLSIPPSHLMRLALQEYMPDTFKDLERCFGKAVTDNERILLEIWRDATDNQDPPIPEEAVKGLHQGFVTVMKR